MAELVDRRKKIVSSYFFKHVSLYLSFGALQYIVLKLILSLVAFFHLLLNHKFSIIEEWTYRNAWEIVILNKVICFWIIFQFINLKIESEASVRRFFNFKNLRFPRQVLIVGIILYGAIFYLGGPVVNERVVEGRFYPAFAFFGHLVYYGSDLLIFFFLNDLYPFKRKREKLSMACFMASLFFAFNLITYTFAGNLNFFMFLSFLLLILVASISIPHSEIPLFLLILVVAPLSTFWGLDPIWGDDFSFFTLKKIIPSLQYLGAFFLCTFYFWKTYQPMTFHKGEL